MILFKQIQSIEYYNQIIDEQKLLLNENIESFKIEAAKAKEILLSSLCDCLCEENFEENRIRNITILHLLLSPLCLFPDDEIIKRLKEFKISNTLLKWFIPYDSILFEIKKSEDVEGVICLTNNKFILLKTHIESKMNHQLLMDYNFIEMDDKGKYRTKVSLMFEKEAKNAKRRKTSKDYSDGFVGFTKKSIAYQKSIITSFTNDINITDNKILKISNGNTKEILNDFSKLFFNDIISKRKYFILLFPLLKLVCKDVNFEDKIDFDENKSKYQDNYSNYQFNHVKKILIGK